MYNECDKHQRVYAQGLLIPQLQNTTAQIYQPLRPPADCPSLSQQLHVTLKRLGPVPDPYGPSSHLSTSVT